MKVFHAIAAALLPGLAFLAWPTAVSAHPHVWVVVETEVAFNEQQAITGFRHKWTFDEAYAAMAIEGLDKNADGKYDRGELQELAEINVNSLKEFNYFTFPTVAGKPIDCLPPKDYWLEYTDNKLTLYLTVPLKESLAAEQLKGFRVGVYDAAYYVDFTFAKDNPVRLSAAPAGCTPTIKDPNQQQSQEMVSSLSQAGPMDQLAPSSDAGLYAKSVTISCPG
jgi:ABC-type uncharacterized transport system substrate-binding protein